MASGSENTTNRVYVASDDFGWVPARVISDKPAAAGKLKVQVRDYDEDLSIPACEVSSVAKPSEAQTRRGLRTIPMKELEVNLDDYSGKVLPLQNVDEDGKLIEVRALTFLSSLYIFEMSLTVYIFSLFCRLRIWLILVSCMR